MYSSRCPRWIGPLAYGRALVTRMSRCCLLACVMVMSEPYVDTGWKDKTGFWRLSGLIAPGKDPIWSETGTDDTFRADNFHPNHLFPCLKSSMSLFRRTR